MKPNFGGLLSGAILLILSVGIGSKQLFYFFILYFHYYQKLTKELVFFAAA
jgi:hypothetical protein